MKKKGGFSPLNTFRPSSNLPTSTERATALTSDTDMCYHCPINKKALTIDMRHKSQKFYISKECYTQ